MISKRADQAKLKKRIREMLTDCGYRFKAEESRLVAAYYLGESDTLMRLGIDPRKPTKPATPAAKEQRSK